MRKHSPLVALVLFSLVGPACSKTTVGTESFGDGAFGGESFFDQECMDPSPEVERSIRFADGACLDKALANGASVNAIDGSGDAPIHRALDSGALFFAKSKKRKSIIVEILVARGADVNARNRDGKAPLHLAMENAEAREIRDYLIDKTKADVNALDRNVAPIHYAITTKDDALASKLLARGAQVDLRAGNGGRRPLELALMGKAPGIAEQLLAKGASIVGDRDEASPLSLALNSGYPALALSIIAKGAAIGAVDPYGSTPLLQASLYGNDDVVRVLLARRSEIALDGRNREGNTSLHLALEASRWATADLLIQAGADISLTDDEGRNAINIAAQRGANSTVSELLRRRADPNVKNKQGRGALHETISAGHVETSMALLAGGADLEQKDREGTTPLLSSLVQGQRVVAEGILARSRAQVNVADSRGRTPLMLSTIPEVTRALLTAGAEVNVADGGGRTPLSYAVVSGNTQVYRALVDAKGDIARKDADGNTLLHLAVENNALEIARDLIPSIGVDARNVAGRTPLFGVRTREALEMLVASRATINALDTGGFHVLAAKLRATLNLDLVAALIGAGADLKWKDRAGDTLLHRTVKSFQWDAATTLLENGMDANLLDAKRRTAIYLARDTEDLRFFLRYRFDLASRDLAGRTVLGAFTYERSELEAELARIKATGTPAAAAAAEKRIRPEIQRVSAVIEKLETAGAVL